MNGILELFKTGGFIMIPLGVCSILVWVIVFERWLRFRKLGREMATFHLEAMNSVLRSDLRGLKNLCQRGFEVPNAQVVRVALDRRSSKDSKVRDRWEEAVERERQKRNQELKRALWILGTIASSAPFIGLFGTVVGILRSFHDIAKSGVGGFAVVAGGISEALIATAAGILVAVMASIAFNVFQTQWSQLVLRLKHETAEFLEIFSQVEVHPES